MTDNTTAVSDLAVTPALTEFLTDFALALHRYAVYPEGHPQLEAATDAVLDRLRTAFVDRQAVALGVTPTQVLLGGVPVELKGNFLRGLAVKLHKRDVGAVKLSRGISREEVVGVMRTLAGGADRPLEASERTWPHAHILSLVYDHLELNDDNTPVESSAPRAVTNEAEALWVELARLAANRDVDVHAVLSDPALVARALATGEGKPLADEEIVGYLDRFVTLAKDQGSAEAAALERYVTTLVSSLSADTLDRVLALPAIAARRADFVLGVSQIVAVDAVVSLVESGAKAARAPISPALVSLFSKLAEHATRGPLPARGHAEESLRLQLRSLIDGWRVSDGRAAVPEAYRAAERRSPDLAESYHAEPDRVVRISLETDTPCAMARRAAETMIERGWVAELLEILAGAGETSAAADLREAVRSPNALRKLLARTPIDLEAAASLVSAIGAPAAGPLLEALARETERTVRWRLLELTAGLGKAIVPDVMTRFDGAEWYVQRNLLTILGMLPDLPPGTSVAPYAKHGDGRVRFEAIKLMLRSPVTQARAIAEALAATDERTVRLGLNAALERCPATAVPALIRRAADPDGDPALRVLAIRAASRIRTPASLDCLMRLSLTRRRWFKQRGLLPKSPIVLEAVTGLARHWRDNTTAEQVIKLAQRHADGDFRLAADADEAVDDA